MHRPQKTDQLTSAEAAVQHLARIRDRNEAMAPRIRQWSLTTLRERLVKIGAKIVRHGRSGTFQLAEVIVSRDLFKQILGAIAALRRSQSTQC